MVQSAFRVAGNNRSAETVSPLDIVQPFGDQVQGLRKDLDGRALTVNEARESAALMDRTPTAQIEFWAKLGRVMEGVLTHDAIVTVKEASPSLTFPSLISNDF